MSALLFDLSDDSLDFENFHLLLSTSLWQVTRAPNSLQMRKWSSIVHSWSKGFIADGGSYTGVVFKGMLLKLDIEETEKVSVCLVVGICDSIT